MGKSEFDYCRSSENSAPQIIRHPYIYFNSIISLILLELDFSKLKCW